MKGIAIAALWLSSVAASNAVQAQPGSAEFEPSHVYTTQRGDSVIGISRQLLRDPRSWAEVATFNRLKNPNRIATGIGLRVPLRLLSSEGVSAQVEHVHGDVRTGPGAAAVALRGGEALAEGSALQTGADGSAVVRLADGTLLRLAAGSRMQIERARRYPSVDHVSSGIKLEQGRVEVEATKAVAGKPGFEVRTPQGVLGVRGTEFRAKVVGDRQITGGEVLGGAVQFAGDAAGRRLGAGFGTVIDADHRVEEPTALLPAPDLGAMPVLQERLVLRFPLPALAGATGFRGQVARDAAMREVLADNLAQGSELRFTDLEDGDYVLGVRAIDARGLEGRDSTLAFRLKARPEPPLPSAPSPRGVTRGTKVSLTWAANPQAASYHLQVAGDERFAGLVRDVPAVTDTSFDLDGIAPGEYFWRLASVRAGNDQGPWGSVRSFVLRPPPATPPPPAIGDKTLQFSWEGEPGQTFEFQLATDASFAQLLLERKLDRPEIDVPRPAGGVYFMRLRARDADGFQGPFTSPQRFEIIDCAQSGDGTCVRTGTDLPLRRQ